MLGNRVHPEYSNPRAWRGRLPDVDDPAATQLWPDQKRLWQPPPEAIPLHSVRVPWSEQPFTRFTWTLIRVSGIFAALAVIAVALRVIWAVWPR